MSIIDLIAINNPVLLIIEETNKLVILEINMKILT
jgi:hypothetical protein